jgi:hypothetical protein
VHIAAEVHDTLSRTVDRPLTLGVVWIDHDVPSHLSAKGT